MWSNGAPHWECEKRLWEAEEEKKWSEVLSRRQKQAAKKSSSSKVVGFDKNLIQQSPKVKSRPRELVSSIKVGSVSIDLSAEFGSSKCSSVLPGILKSTTYEIVHETDDVLHKEVDCSDQIPQDSLNIGLNDPSQDQGQSSDELVISISNSNPTDWHFKIPAAVIRARRFGDCTRCFGTDHNRFNCKSAIRCAGCFNYGHKFRYCVTKSRPKVCWWAKSFCLTQEPTREGEETLANSISPPIHSAELENPNKGVGSHATTYAAPAVHLHRAPSATPGPSGEDGEASDMANFAVNPVPFVLVGLEIEDWARPARGRIIVSGNPPRHHEEYAIVTVLPPPQQHQLYDTMDEVIDYFEHEHHVRVLSSCLSPLGLCLIQFHSPIARQTMVNLSPHQLDDVRELVVEEHDRGLNLRNCLFARTCWIMFLAFPLDFQTRDIISQAVGHTIITWTNNARCKSRLLLRCKVTLVSRIPRSLLICEGNVGGNNGSSWAVPVYVLSSLHADEFAADEDQIPPNGNPHPENAHFLNVNLNAGNQGLFEDVGDLAEVPQGNVDQGWEIPPPPPAQNNNNGWGPWLQQDGVVVDENELVQVNNLADIAVANAVMQHPDQPQDSVSVNSEAREFFRAQGPPITLELPLPATAGRISADRTLVISRNNVQTFESDYQVRQMAARLGLHASFGPSPSVEMLLEHMAMMAKEALLLLPLKDPVPPTNWNFRPTSPEMDTW